MPRRSSRSRASSGRVPRRNARRRPPAPDVFDDNWLNDIRDTYSDYIDLTRSEDRRRWDPTRRDTWTKRPGPRGLRGRPRIVVVPEGHKLARLQTYGGRFSLSEVLARRRRLRRGDRWEERSEQNTGRIYKSSTLDVVSSRVGFHLPWQVIICVRRKRRREVMHALRIAGKRGVGAGKPQRRGEYSEVRC